MRSVRLSALLFFLALFVVLNAAACSSGGGDDDDSGDDSSDDDNGDDDAALDDDSDDDDLDDDSDDDLDDDTSDDDLDDDTSDDDLDDDTSDDDTTDDDTTDDDTTDDDTTDDDTSDDDTVDDDTTDDDTTDDDTTDDDTVDDDTVTECYDETVECGDVVSGTTTGAEANLNGYSCNETMNASGPEVVYRFELGVACNLSIYRGSASYSQYYALLTDCEDPDTCLYGGEYGLTANDCVDPGTYYLVVDGQDGASGNYNNLDFSCTPCGSTVWYESFNSYTVGSPPPSPWTFTSAGTATANIEEAALDTPTNRLVHFVANGPDDVGIERSFGSNLTGVVGLNARYSQTVSSSDIYFELQSNTDASEVMVEWIGSTLRANLPLDEGGGTQDCVTGLDYATWYQVTIIADVAAKTFDVYVEGNLTSCADIGFWHGTSDNLASVLFYNPGSAEVDGYLDNVEIFTVP